MYNFKRFEAIGGKFTVSITLSKPGGLSFSSGFCNKYKTEQYNAVALYYDENSKVIAIKLLNEAENGTFKFKNREDGKGAYSSTISFIKSYDLEKYLGTRYTPEEYEDEDIGKVFLLKLS